MLIWQVVATVELVRASEAKNATNNKKSANESVQRSQQCARSFGSHVEKKGSRTINGRPAESYFTIELSVLVQMGGLRENESRGWFLLLAVDAPRGSGSNEPKGQTPIRRSKDPDCRNRRTNERRGNLTRAVRSLSHAPPYPYSARTKQDEDEPGKPVGPRRDPRHIQDIGPDRMFRRGVTSRTG